MSVPSGSSTLAHVYCLWASSAIYCMWLRLLSAASAAFRSLPRRILRGEAQPFHIITPFEGTSPGVLPVESHFLALCGHYRVEPRVCQPARPQTKGKIERPFFYLEEHFIKGNSWRDFPHFCDELARFTVEVLDVREHHTT